MKIYLIAFFIVLAVSASVPQLTADNFFTEIASNQFLFVKFFSPGCGHCVAIAPEYQLLHQHSEGREFRVVEVDCSQHRQICVESGVKGLPMLQIYVSGIPFPYDGPRTFPAMAQWIQSLQQATLTPLKEADAKKMIGSETFVIVSGLTKKTQRMIAIATKLHDTGIRFYSYLLRGLIGIYKPGITTPIRYNTDQYFPMSLVDWAFEEGRQAIACLSKERLSYAKRQQKFEYVLGVVYEDDGFSLEEISGWCAQNLKNILCLKVSKKNPLYEDFKKLGKAKQGQTTVFIAKKDFSIGYHFPHSSATAQNLRQFFENAKSDKLERIIDVKRDLSERIKYTNVVKLTPQTYKTFLAENEVVFVEYYAPTCGHCVKFAEEYESVATHFKGIDSNVAVAALDLTGEEDGIMKEQGIRGYPHFRFFIRGNKVMYRGARSAEAIIKFIADLSVAKFHRAASLEDISAPKPFVTISGVEENSYLNVVSGLFTLLPIYHTSSEGEFSVTIHGERRVKQYSGKVDAADISEWLEVETSPVLASLGVSTPTKRLEKALLKHDPLLVVVNKHEPNVFQPIVDLLGEYCEDKTAFVCGYLHKGEEDYQMLLKWFGDKDTETNRLFWIITEKSLKYNYPGDLSSLDSNQLDEFIRAAQAGEVPAFPVKEEEKAVESNLEEL